MDEARDADAVRREADTVALAAVSPRDIRWEEESPAEIEDLISALILDMHSGAFRVEGAGGDGGRDCVVPDGGAAKKGVVSIKSFTRRIGKSQRTQIKRSLVEALKHNPTRWELIAPLELTPGERFWFEGLQETTDVPLEFKGLTWLLTELARRPALVRMYSRTARERVLELAGEYNAEQAVLAGGAHDVVERISRVRRQSAELDPDFAVVVTTGPDGETVQVVPTKPDALERRPITGKLDLVFDRTTPEGRAVCDPVIEALKYGGNADVPAEMIRAASLEAPLGLGFDTDKQEGTVQLLLRESADAAWSATGRLDVLAITGKAVTASLPLTFHKRTSGNAGGRLFATDVSGAFTVTLTFDRISEPHLSLAANYERPPDAPPSEVLPVLSFLNALGHTDRMAIYCARKELASGSIDASNLAVSDGYLRFLELLGRIEAGTGTPFPLPEDLDDDDVAHLVLVDRLLAGESVPLARTNVRVTIRAEAGEQAAEALEAGADGAAIFATEELTLLLGGTLVPVGHVGTFTHVRLGKDADEATKILAQLRETGRRAGAGEDMLDVVVPLNPVGPDGGTKRLLTAEEVADLERRHGPNRPAA